MVAAKIIILCGFFAVALGFTIPQDQLDQASLHDFVAYAEEFPFEDSDVILVRNARSPQRRVDANVQHSSQHGTSASVDYTHPLGKNLDAYAGASRNFKYNDNGGHVGLRYRF